MKNIKKTKNLNIRMTEEQHNNFSREASEFGLSLTAYAYKKLAEGIDHLMYDPEAVAEIRRANREFDNLASLIQKIARQVNPDDWVSTSTLHLIEDELRELKIKLSVILEKITSRQKEVMENGNDPNAKD